MLDKPFNVDLAQCPSDTIDHVVDDKDLLFFTRQIGVDPTEFIVDEILEEQARVQSKGNIKAQFLSRDTVKDALRKDASA